jgi:uncharacterized membrane protein YhaH (DUF805 family)
MSDVTQDAWFYTRNGEQTGPVTLAELRAKAANRELDPRHDMVWRTGMDEWQPAGEIEGLFERHSEAPPVPAAAMMAAAPNPYESSIDESHDQLMARETEWPGVKRFGYIVGSLLLGIVANAAAELLRPIIEPTLGEYTPWVVIGVPVLMWILSIVLMAKRFSNLGMSAWWILGNLVPFLNLWVGYRLFACPPGYAMHRKMDGIGIFLAILYWLFVVVAIALVAFVIAALTGAAGSPDFQENIREAIEQARARQSAR